MLMIHEQIEPPVFGGNTVNTSKFPVVSSYLGTPLISEGLVEEIGFRGCEVLIIDTEGFDVEILSLEKTPQNALHCSCVTVCPRFVICCLGVSF